MKKLLIVLVMLLMITPCVYAQNRGALTNVFASWYSVTTAQKVVTFPGKSRDLFIQNGSTVEMYVDLRGSTIPPGCVDGRDGSGIDVNVFKLDSSSQISLVDYITDSITLVSPEGTASPVSVIVTY